MVERKSKSYLIIFLLIVFCVAIPLFVKYISFDIESVSTYPPPTTSTIYSSDGEKVFDFYRENRTLIAYDDIPEMLVRAFLAAEDANFFTHPGVSLTGILRALVVNIVHGRITQGASTITQQLARECFLNRDRNYIRKIKEALYAVALEVRYTKKEIFAFWLNHIYLGYGSYGIKVAAQNYFDKDLAELNLTECAFLASLPKSPSRYFRDLKQAKARMEYVLGQMIKNDFISRIDADVAIIIPFSITPKKIQKKNHYVEYVRRYIEKKYGANYLYGGGLEIYIAMDSLMQEAASEAIEGKLAIWDKKRDNGTMVEGSLLSMESGTGYVRAMIGGRDFDKNQWNKATQARRQPGSAFKPFIYSAAFTYTDYGPDSFVNDTRTSFKNPFSGNDIWRIKNYGDKYRGFMFLKDAFAFSSNTVAVKTLQKIGMNKTLDYLQRFKINSKFCDDLTLALGTSSVSLFDMVRAYSVFANHGTMVEPIFVEKILMNGEIIEKNRPQITTRIVDYKTARQIDGMLKYAVDHGTGKSAKVTSLKVSGKTGTSSKNRDAWFVGYTDDLITGVWVGYEDFNRQLGRAGTGSSLAAPIFKNYLVKSINKQSKKKEAM
jgi:penicillin-binding protein 1A